MSRENNFDFLRVTAAFLVLFSHSYPLFGNSPEPIGQLTGYIKGGGIAVSVFFVISGFLVTGSLISRGNVPNYLAARALRIFPALFVVVFVSTFLLGPLFTKLDTSEYLQHPQTWTYLLNVFVFPLQFVLPAIFVEHPHASEINGSLWTLPIELLMYMLLPPLLWLGLLARRTALFLPVIFYCAYVIGVNAYGLGWENRGPVLLGSVDTFNLLRLGVYFFAGVALFVYRDIVKVDGRIAVCCLLLLASTFHTPVGSSAAAIAIPYLVYYTAFCSAPLHRLTTALGDISYGVYIWAFPVQQIVFELFHQSLNFWVMMLVSFAATTVLAFLSWTLVEQPTLRLKKYITS